MVALVGVSMVVLVFALGLFVLVATLRGALRRRAGVVRQVADADIERELRAGRAVAALQLYREKTGAGAEEAQRAIEAWRTRLGAS
jgi:hypothetical protein